MSSPKKPSLSENFGEGNQPAPSPASPTSKTNNGFMNFLSEFRKITSSVKLTSVQISRIGGELWRRMSGAQKSQFKVVEARRRRKKAGGGVKRRRRRGRRGH